MSLATGYKIFKAAYSQTLTYHFLFILAHLLSVNIFLYDLKKINCFYGNFQRAKASNYYVQKERLENLFNEGIFIV